MAISKKRTTPSFRWWATHGKTSLQGFCTGPILGAVLTVAAASGGAITGATLLATYALGMTAPVFALAMVWDRWRIGERRLTQRTVRLGTFQLPLTRLLAGSLFVVLGVTFVAFRASSALSGLYQALGLEDLVRAAELAITGSNAP